MTMHQACAGGFAPGDVVAAWASRTLSSLSSRIPALAVATPNAARRERMVRRVKPSPAGGSSGGGPAGPSSGSIAWVCMAFSFSVVLGPLPSGIARRHEEPAVHLHVEPRAELRAVVGLSLIHI